VDADSHELALIKASLVISGDNFDPLGFERALQLHPAEITIRGERRPSGRGVYPFSTWSYTIDKRSDTTDSVVTELLDELWPIRESLTSFFETHPGELRIVCSVTITDERPLLEFAAQTLGRIAALNSSLLVDVYDYS
jgi:hypothetical protein